MSEGGGKLWGGRFTEATDAFVERFTASVAFDQRLARHDLGIAIENSIPTFLTRIFEFIGEVEKQSCI